MNEPYFKLVKDVLQAIRDYDLSRDHTRHELSETDCVRCKLIAALPPFAQDELTGNGKSTRQRWANAGRRFFYVCEDDELFTADAPTEGGAYQVLNAERPGIRAMRLGVLDRATNRFSQ